MNIGILALQGAFAEHAGCVARLGARPVELRQRGHLDLPLGGIILPGGESTVQGKLLRELGMLGRLREMIAGGLPAFGTCAGLILLAKRIEGGEEPHLGALDATVRRNAYGRQLGSFRTVGLFGAGDGARPAPMTFIRAPAITECGDGVEELARVEGVTVAARQGRVMATAFHPELDAEGDLPVHRMFLELCVV